MSNCCRMPSLHHGDAVAHRHGLDLVVGHVEVGGLQAAVQLADLGAGLHAQLGVEVGQRLVHQEDLRLAHDGAAQRDALALAAGELARLAVEELVRSSRAISRATSLAHAARRCRCRLAALPAACRRACLRIAGRRPCCRRRSCAGRARSSGRPSRCRGLSAATSLTTRSPMRSSPPVISSRPGEHAQRGGLAAAGRADQHQELVVADIQVQVVDGQHVAIFLINMFKRHTCHCRLLSKIGGRSPFPNEMVCAVIGTVYYSALAYSIYRIDPV